jgi:hypothetical protein
MLPWLLTLHCFALQLQVVKVVTAREARILQQLPPHRNVVSLLDVRSLGPDRLGIFMPQLLPYPRFRLPKEVLRTRMQQLMMVA